MKHWFPFLHRLIAKPLLQQIYGTYNARTRVAFKEDIHFIKQFLQKTVKMSKTRHLTNSFYTGGSLQKLQPSNLTTKTVAVDYNQGAGKIFTAADLWKIQHRRENRVQIRTIE